MSFCHGPAEQITSADQCLFVFVTAVLLPLKSKQWYTIQNTTFFLPLTLQHEKMLKFCKGGAKNIQLPSKNIFYCRLPHTYLGREHGRNDHVTACLHRLNLKEKIELVKYLSKVASQVMDLQTHTLLRRKALLTCTNCSRELLA